ncbi:MAG: tRNA dihydrouridine synthase DusB [Desulfomonile tiedjei]|uniref:tRNA-dihydrouridine synthase n=1 Tax=Desulfomonile tiedjei TaxID=2358 RepID=A0A9D6Z3U7_9BACT|nr:tRNA dihydrouridine synthase DusB [Desulfomonile tiedjei]
MKIGNLEIYGNVFLAPMAGITDTPFRRLVQDFGVSAVWTEMLSAAAIAGDRGTFRTLDLEGHVVPTFFQISGKDPGIMAEAANRIQDMGAAAIDVNMGCPARKIVGRGEGAALMKDVSLAGRIIAAIRKVLSIPLTAKIRSGWDETSYNAAEMAKVLELEGADALIIHPRSRSHRHSGPPALSVIQEVKQSVGIPVVGNGGILEVQDAVAMVGQTCCDGVMIGRGALGRPWLPGQILVRFGLSSNGSSRFTTFFDVIREHLGMQVQWWGTLGAVLRMRKHLAWYSRGFAGGAEFRKRVFRIEEPEAVLDCVEEFFGKVVIS